jgi:hypothetical protein
MTRRPSGAQGVGQVVIHKGFSAGPATDGTRNISKGLILAQNERWRRGLGMQVVRIACYEWRKGE